jgi:hypothetical protein
MCVWSTCSRNRARRSTALSGIGFPGYIAGEVTFGFRFRFLDVITAVVGCSFIHRSIFAPLS